ncbi:leucine-rich repeat domain-containing protein [Treponema vincentii]|uniref:Leucine-rich repeat domain-containing protein n=1 Tax=Treponema vincentii TaxID=69710 RepID=A0A6P1XZK9_9SPIR|nr:leucine-rich repeat protein [Treponema vincentii]QHX43016.1 leucine-rich repeat domain-containing protein [Treponema vincentii]
MKTIHKKNTTFLNLAAAALMVAALVLGCKPNVSNGGEVQPPVTDGCTITMSAGANGSITASPVIPAGGKVAKGTEITFTATANPGYRVDTWTITGGTIQAGGQQGDTTAKVKVIADTTVNVMFKPIVYTPVAYADLPNHLTTAQPETNGIYYIEVTGLTAPDVKGNFISDSASPLGQILNSNKRKKVALKFGTMPYVTNMTGCFNGCTSLVQVSYIPDSVTDMKSCFKGCTNLVQVSNIPDSITDMWGCFAGCTNLEQVSNIPNSVKDMGSCFRGCTKLEHVPNIPDSVTNMGSCFYGCTSLTSVTLKCEYLDGKFNYASYGCSSLSVGSIKVPEDSLDDYKDNADKMKAEAEWFAKDE